MARSMIARQNLKLNLVPGGVPPVLNVSQYDSAYDVHFTIYNGAQLFEIPDDVSIEFQETKRDGNGFTVGATKSAQTGQCYIWMQEQMSAVPGDQICELVLTNTTEDQIGTANFIMRVEPAALNKNTVISESEIAYANQVLAQLGSVAAYKAQLDAQGDDIEQLNTNLAAEIARATAAEATLRNTDASLQSQIDQLIAPEGAAPSAAEVENARVGADGTVYPTLGDAIRGQVTDVKSQLNSELGYEVTTTETVTYTDGYAIGTAAANLGQVVESSSNSVSNKISLDNVVRLKCYYYQGTNPYGSYFFYDSNDGYISHNTIGNSSDAITIPQNASYMRYYCMTSKKANIKVETTVEIMGAVYTALDGKVAKNQGIQNSGRFLYVDDSGNVALKPIKEDNTGYSGDCPLFVSMMPDFFWVSMNEIAAFSASLPKYKDGISRAENNAWFAITGDEGDSYVTIVNGGNGDVADITAEEKTKPFGCVIMYDDGSYEPCNAQYLTDTTFSVYPPLKDDISAGELAQIRTGIHLSRRGYRAYSQFLYNVEPKYTEKSYYIARWRAEENVLTFPWTVFGSTYLIHQTGSNNISTNFVNKLRGISYKLGYSEIWGSDHLNNTPGGIEWTVNIDSLDGYVEFYLGIKSGSDSTYSVATEDAFICELWIDDVLAKTYTKTLKVCERICFDFSGGKTAKLKIYCNRWQIATGHMMYLNRVTWWVNKKYLATGEKLIPTGTVVAQYFDSWGEFDDSESAVYLQKEINADVGVPVPYYNESKSNQTSAWGKAWFFDKVWSNRPSMMLTNFGINDATSSSESSTLPSEIEGPDGEMYDNIISQEDYDVNMGMIKRSCLNNKIIPVFVGVGLAYYQAYPNQFIDDEANSV